MNFDEAYIRHMSKCIKNNDVEKLNVIRQQLDLRLDMYSNKQKNKFCRITPFYMVEAEKENEDFI
jgi:hypothetical protein